MPYLVLYATLYNANVSSLIKHTPPSGVLLYVLHNRAWKSLLLYGYGYLQPSFFTRVGVLSTGKSVVGEWLVTRIIFDG